MCGGCEHDETRGIKKHESERSINRRRLWWDVLQATGHCQRIEEIDNRAKANFVALLSVDVDGEGNCLVPNAREQLLFVEKVVVGSQSRINHITQLSALRVVKRAFRVQQADDALIGQQAPRADDEVLVEVGLDAG